MPRGNKSSQKQNVESDDEDATYANQTQTQSLTQAERAVASYTAEEKEQKVNEIVQFMLMMDNKKLPIKKLDINKNVLKECSRGFEAMFQQAKTKLKNVFGINVFELDNSKQKSYILVNQYWSDSDYMHLNWSKEDNQKTGLLMIVLSIIFMNQNVTPDTLMWHTLKKLGIDSESHHPVFGDVKKLVTQEFVRQAYIEYIRHPQSDPPTYEFRWGDRTYKETTRRKVLQFVCRIYGDGCTLDQWRMQYQEVLQDEGKPANGVA